MYGDVTCVIGQNEVGYQNGPRNPVQLHLPGRNVGIKAVAVSRELTYLLSDFH